MLALAATPQKRNGGFERRCFESSASLICTATRWMLFTHGAAKQSSSTSFLAFVSCWLNRIGHDFVDPQAVFKKLVYQSHWRSWPKQETDSIEKYFRFAWDAVLNSDPDDLGFDGAEGWLESIAQAEQDLSPYLEFWLACPSENAHRNLARTILFFPFTKSPSGYWGDRKEQFQQVAEWLRRPEVRQKLIAAVEAWSGAPFGSELFDAAALL